MSSINLSTLINEFPEETEAVKRLAGFIDGYLQKYSRQAEIPIELTVQRLFDIAHPSSQRVLARMLSRLVEQGVLKQIIRVESDTKGGIGDFDSITDIPPVMFDEHVGHEVEVNFDRVRMIYKPQSLAEPRWQHR